MAGDKRLYLYWDPGIDGAFRRRFVLYCDEQHLRVMPISVTGRVVE